MENDRIKQRKTPQSPIKMESLSLKAMINHLQKNRKFLYERFGVIRIGVFGSFVRGEHTSSSDIDMVVEMEGNRKNIHSFLQLKREQGEFRIERQDIFSTTDINLMKS